MVQFLKWVICFQVFSPHILAGVYHFLVADLFSYPWFMPAAPQLLDGCNTLWVCIDLASWYAWRNVNSAFIWHLFKVELMLHLRLIQSWYSFDSTLSQCWNINGDSMIECQRWINVCMSTLNQRLYVSVYSSFKFKYIFNFISTYIVNVESPSTNSCSLGSDYQNSSHSV